jgi:hypothetical protein
LVLLFNFRNIINPEIENLLNNIGNETLNQLADQNQRFSNRFVPNSENERISFIHSRENINTTRKMNEKSMSGTCTLFVELCGDLSEAV